MTEQMMIVLSAVLYGVVNSFNFSAVPDLKNLPRHQLVSTSLHLPDRYCLSTITFINNVKWPKQILVEA